MRSYNPHPARGTGLGYSLFARHYSGNHYCFLFLRVLRCFSSPGWLPFGCRIFNAAGCPIRKSADISLVCSSPQLIAAYHVLLRLSEPRHPPYALKCFKRVCRYSSFTTCYFQYVKELICKIAALQMFGLRIPDPNVTSSFVYCVEVNGVEPMTPCLQSRCSSQLS
jgi:hypothetical protein